MYINNPHLRLALAATLVLFSSTSCTQPGETTAVGAATGGAMGAGAGALVGNQAGSAAGGFLVGAVAGASTGAMIGNVLEAQEQEGYRRDEAIERQEQMLRAQRGQIEELRRLSQDSVQYRGGPVTSGNRAVQSGQRAGAGSVAGSSQVATNRGVVSGSVPSGAVSPGAVSSGAVSPGAISPGAMASRSQTAPRTTSSGLSERTIVSEPAPPQRLADTVPSPRASASPTAIAPPSAARPTAPSFVEVPAEQPVRSASESSTTSQPGPSVASNFGEGESDITGSAASAEVFAVRQPSSPECVEAREEFRQGSALQENSDKLFHYRRALRLCPEDPAIQNAMGELYVSLGRIDDAQYQFQEALRIEPGYQTARQNLANLSSGDRY